MLSHIVLNKIYFCEIEKCTFNKSASSLPAMLYRSRIPFYTCGDMIQIALKGKSQPVAFNKLSDLFHEICICLASYVSL